MIRTHRTTSLGPGGLGRRDRNPSLYGSLWVVAACLIVLATLLLPGCTSYGSAMAVDGPQARNALEGGVDSWKKEESTKSLALSSPPIVVQDFEWDSGAKLIEYQLVDNGKEEALNLRVAVRLIVKQHGGQGEELGKKSLVCGRHQPPADGVP